MTCLLFTFSWSPSVYYASHFSSVFVTFCRSIMSRVNCKAPLKSNSKLRFIIVFLVSICMHSFLRCNKKGSIYFPPFCIPSLHTNGRSLVTDPPYPPLFFIPPQTVPTGIIQWRQFPFFIIEGQLEFKRQEQQGEKEVQVSPEK